MTIPIAAMAKAFTAFFTSSCPTIGDTTLTLGSCSYFSIKQSFTVLISASDKTVSYRITPISLFSPDKTTDFAVKPNSSVACSISSVVKLLSDKTSTREPLVKSMPGFNCKNVSEITPITTTVIVVVKIFLRCFTISTRRLKMVGSTSSFAEICWMSEAFTPNHPLRFVKNPLVTHKPRKNLVPNTAVKKLNKILTINIVANPLTELVPKINNTAAASIVVMLASRIVTSEFLPPALKEASTDFPVRNSSLIRSNVKTLASTAIPTPKMSAAIPGNVSTPCISWKTSKIKNT